MYQAGLVLEGGGMKGVYTAGVLDFFTEKGIDFSHIYGVSAGACHMCSYLSRQKGRALSVSVDYLDTRRYCSLESLLTSGDLFNVDFCYHLIHDRSLHGTEAVSSHRSLKRKSIIHSLSCEL